jgi:uncharacterized protein (DUF433 family)
LPEDGRSSVKFKYLDRIVRDPKICGGQPVIKGTRIRIKVILDNLAEEMEIDEIIKSYPGLTPADVQAVISFAAASASEEHCYPVPEALSSL